MFCRKFFSVIGLFHLKYYLIRSQKIFILYTQKLFQTKSKQMSPEQEQELFMQEFPNEQKIIKFKKVRIGSRRNHIKIIKLRTPPENINKFSFNNMKNMYAGKANQLKQNGVLVVNMSQNDFHEPLQEKLHPRKNDKGKWVVDFNGTTFPLIFRDGIEDDINFYVEKSIVDYFVGSYFLVILEDGCHDLDFLKIIEEKKKFVGDQK